MGKEAGTFRMRQLSILALLLFQCAVFVRALSAQDVRWVTVEGEAPAEQGKEGQAKKQAVDAALRRAVREALGSTVSIETLIVNLRLSGGIMGSIPYGRVVEHMILEEGEVASRRQGEEKPSRIYKVKIKAGVIEDAAGMDPAFRVESSLNNSSFHDGDVMLITIRSTKDCYITIFSITEDEKVIRLIPNRYKPKNFIKADTSFQFPDKEDRGKGITLKAHLPGRTNAVTESIYVIATKQPILINPGVQEGIFGIYDGKTAFMGDLIRDIVTIPLSERAEKLMQYQVIRKKGGSQ